VNEHVEEGNRKFAAGDYRGAEADYTRALELVPESDEAYFGRGAARVRIEDSPGAIADFTKVIELDPGCAEAYLLRGVPRYLLGDREGAGRDWAQAGQLGLEEGREMLGRLIAPPEADKGNRTGGLRRA